MYLVRTITDRGKFADAGALGTSATDAETGRALIKDSLSKPLAGLMTDAEVEAIRQRIVALPSPPQRPKLKSEDLLAALAVFLLVVAATFPVAIPFLIIDDIGLAKPYPAQSRWRCCSSVASRWVDTRDTAAGKPD